jgi:hypothetical protein
MGRIVAQFIRYATLSLVRQAKPGDLRNCRKA